MYKDIRNKMIKKNKKAVSLMVSYVLLVSIVIIVSIGVFAWLRSVANINPPTDCKEGTSIVLEDYLCTNGPNGGIDLYLKNNGYFNINGVILSVGNDTGIFPVVYLMPEFNVEFQANVEGHSFFNEALEPGEITSANFSNIDGQDMELVDFDNIRIIQIQPFVVEKTGKVVCQNSVIKQEINGCVVGGTCLTCTGLGYNCGIWDDTCGGQINCGSCNTGAGESCVTGTCVLGALEQVTYYFDDYDSNDAWERDARRMVNSDLTSYAQTNNNGDTQTNDRNNCSGTDLGTINSVKMRIFQRYDPNRGTEGDINATIKPIFSGTDGSEYLVQTPTDPGSWSPYYDITLDSNAPSTWTWNDIQNLDVQLQAYRVDGRIFVSNVQISVEYLP